MENKGCCAEKPADNTCSTEKPGPCGPSKCCGVILKGAFFGGVVMFIYFSASWTLLPWHKDALAGFINAGTMVSMLGKAFLLCLFGAALLTKLLKKCALCGCCPVLFSMIVALLVASFSYLPNMIWHNMPLNIALQGMLDSFLAFTLAGLAIAKLVLKSGPCTMGKCGTEKCDDKKTSCH